MTLSHNRARLLITCVCFLASYPELASAQQNSQGQPTIPDGISIHVTTVPDNPPKAPSSAVSRPAKKSATASKPPYPQVREVRQVAQRANWVLSGSAAVV